MQSLALTLPSLMVASLALYLATKPITVDLEKLVSNEVAWLIAGTLALVSGVAATLSFEVARERAKSKLSSDAEQGDSKSAVVTRLLSELERVSSTGNMCLLVGIVIAALGVCYAMFSMPTVLPPGADTKAVALHLVPRISILIVMELFAYFFLKTYRQTFEHLRFYHNEATTMEIKLKALHIAQSMGATGAPTVQKLVLAMVQEDRHKNSPKIAQETEEGALLDSAINIIEVVKKAKE